MKVLIVYDSVFGNTEKVALTVSEALGADHAVSALKVGDIDKESLETPDLLIMGSPTRAFRPTKAMTLLLKTLPDTVFENLETAFFDTRISIRDVDSRLLRRLVGWFGYAAEPMAALAVRRGAHMVLQPEGFYVVDTEGPLKDGELERAATWALRIVAEIENRA